MLKKITKKISAFFTNLRKRKAKKNFSPNHFQSGKKITKLAVEMICLDLDHTLLDFNQYLANLATTKAIKKARKLGKEVVIVTGRSLENSLLTSQALNLSYHVCFSGAIVYSLKLKKIIHSEKFSSKAVTFLQANLAFWTGKIFTTLYALSKDQKTLQSYFKGQPSEEFLAYDIALKNFSPTTTWKILAKENFFRMSIFGKEKVLIKLLTLLKKWPDLVNVVHNYPTVIEVTPAGVDKSKAVDFLRQRKKITWKQILAIGDSYNDLVLFTKVGYGIAVENAVSGLKKVAFATTTRFDDNGVKNALVEWVLPEEKNG